MEYIFLNSTESVEVATLLNNLNNMLLIVSIMLAITMVFICIFAFHISTAIHETKQLIKDNNESKTTKKTTKKKEN